MTLELGDAEAEVLPGGVAIRAPDDAGRDTTVYVDREFVQALAAELEGER